MMLAGLHHQALPQAAHRTFILIADPLLNDICGAAHLGPVDGGSVEVRLLGIILDECESHAASPKSPSTGGSALDHGDDVTASAATRMAVSGARP